MKRDANDSGSVFVPDMITPGQNYDLSGVGPTQSNAALDARRTARCHSLFSVRRNGHQQTAAGSFEDAQAWLFEENREGPFSFESVCEALGLAPPYLRSGLRRWHNQRLAGQSAANRIGRHAPVIPVGRITMHSTESRRRSRSR